MKAHTAAALRRRLVEEQSGSRLPSVAAAVVRGGERAWSDAVGTLDGRGGPAATTDTQYRIGSLTKTFVAVQVLRLREEGAFALSDRIGDHLPEVPFGHVTITQLLTHSSGLQAETSGPWWERTPGGDWSALLASGVGLVAEPGTTFHYSNVGFAVLGELVARTRGVPWGEALRSDLLDPLGMGRTSLRPTGTAAPGLAVHPGADLTHVEPEHDAGAMAPAGQVWSTVDDLATWAAFVGGRTEGLLPERTLRLMQRPAVVDDTPGSGWGAAQGLGLQVWNADGRRAVGHGGSMPGFLAQLRVDVESGDGVVVLANATSGLGRLGAGLLELLAEREPAEPAPWTADTTQAEHLDVVGDWYWGTSLQRLSLRPDGGLVLGEPGVRRGSAFRRDGDGWVGLDGYHRDERLVVVRDAAGVPRELHLQSFVLTRSPYAPDADVPGGLDPEGWR